MTDPVPQKEELKPGVADLEEVHRLLAIARGTNDSLHGLYQGALDTIDRLKKENEEQARLLGMSGSREAKLLAQLSAKEKEISKFTAIIREKDKIIENQDSRKKCLKIKKHKEKR